MKRIKKLSGQDNFIMLIHKKERPEYFGSIEKAKKDAKQNHGSGNYYTDGMDELNDDNTSPQKKTEQRRIEEEEE